MKQIIGLILLIILLNIGHSYGILEKSSNENKASKMELKSKIK